MLATEVLALHDRLDALSASVKEDFRSLADDVLKLRETADQHTTALADLSEGLAGQGERLDAMTTHLTVLETTSRNQADSLALHSDLLDRHTEMLSEILDRLPPRAS